MKREDKKLPLWRKKTRGTLILRKPRSLRIKPKQEVRATLKELGKWVHMFELLENGSGKYKIAKADLPKEDEVEVVVEEKKKTGLKKKDKKDKTKKLPPVEEYSVNHIGGGWWNVISPEGKVMNEESLKAEEAKKLMKTLNSPKPE